VLISTDSVADAEAVAAVLSKNGIRSKLLFGRQDSVEHSNLARAGRPLRVTIAAQSAGRGTSIELAPTVAEIGGLHVICCSFAGVRRTHRQVLSQAARRGQPGSGEVLLCLDQGLLAKRLPRPLQQLARHLAARQGEVPGIVGLCLDALAQRIEEFSQRWALWKLQREDRSWRRRMEGTRQVQ
jgi:preprotein translocase subunit SecA